MRKIGEARNLYSSNDLKADKLITRSAGFPGSIFPSKICFSQSWCLQDCPKAAFICSHIVEAS